METILKSNQHGGARAGAGRPRSNRKKVTIFVTIEEYQLEYLNAEASEQKVSRSEILRSMIDFCWASKYANEFTKWLYASMP